MKKLSFPYPFTGFREVDFLNCFTCAYMFLEDVDLGGTDYQCRKMEGKGCNSCGNCAKGGSTPAWVQEQYFFLFDTMCGRSALRLRFDSRPTQMQLRIGETEESGCGTDETIDFLFGFAGYDYRKATSDFKAEIIASIDAGKPVVARIRAGAGRHRLITGYDNKKLLEPDYKGAQEAPKKPVKYEELEALYIIGEKTAPRYTLKDGLACIIEVMEYNAREKLWEGYFEKIGMYTADSICKADTKEKQARLQRVADTMVHTWNCHNFAEVFRRYGESGAEIYDSVGDMKKLRAPELKEILDRLGHSNGYTHDLAWALVGLNQTADWKGHVYRTGYFGEMAELTLCQIKKNDELVLEIIKQVLEFLRQGEA